MMSGEVKASPVVSCVEGALELTCGKLFSEEMLDTLEHDAKNDMAQFMKESPVNATARGVVQQSIYEDDVYSRVMKLVHPNEDLLTYTVLCAQNTLLELLKQVCTPCGDILEDIHARVSKLQLCGPTLHPAAILLSVLPAYYLSCADTAEDRAAAKRLMLHIAPYQMLALQCLLQGCSDAHRFSRLMETATAEATRVVGYVRPLSGYSGLINCAVFIMLNDETVVTDLRSMARFFDAHPALQTVPLNLVISSDENTRLAAARAPKVIEQLVRQKDDQANAWSELFERASSVLGFVYDEVCALDVSVVSDAWCEAFHGLQVAALYYFRRRENVLETGLGVSAFRAWSEEAVQQEKSAEGMLDLWGLVTYDRVTDLVAALPSTAWLSGQASH